MTYAEFRRWVLFRVKRGSLHTGMRLERGFALLAALYANAHSKDGGYTMFDFMPHESAAPISIDQAMKTWR